LGRYPDPTTARAALAARHHRASHEVLLTAGAAQAFTLIAQATRGYRRPTVVHPQFTEPEVSLRAAGHRVDQVLLRAEDGFRLDPTLVPSDADLVILGNPTNPTSVLHPAATIATLARPGRLLVVDEAFADTTPGEPQSLAGRSDLPGLVVIRSLTKTWALAGLRVGYLLAAPQNVQALAAVQPLWPVSTPALAAATACASPTAVAAEVELARRLAADRAHLVSGLRASPGVDVIGEPAGSFVLVRLQGADRIRVALRARGYAVRRGDTFPGLGTDWLRIAVRDAATTDGFLTALSDALAADTVMRPMSATAPEHLSAAADGASSDGSEPTCPPGRTRANRGRAAPTTRA
jgi:histidinol-phosphate aminotransferase